MGASHFFVCKVCFCYSADFETGFKEIIYRRLRMNNALVIVVIDNGITAFISEI